MNNLLDHVNEVWGALVGAPIVALMISLLAMSCGVMQTPVHWTGMFVTTPLVFIGLLVGFLINK